MLLGRVTGAGLVLGAAACTSVRPIPPAEYLADNAPAVVWVTRSNHTVVELLEPSVKRDTLRGKVNGERVKIPLTDVQAVHAKLPDHKKTALLATTVGVATLSTMYFGFMSKGSGGPTLDCFGDEVVKHPTEHPECF
jgi:hypothetical protein